MHQGEGAAKGPKEVTGAALLVSIKCRVSGTCQGCASGWGVTCSGSKKESAHIFTVVSEAQVCIHTVAINPVLKF